MHAGVIAITLASIIAAIVNLTVAYPCGRVIESEQQQQQQHMNVFVIADSTGCPAELIKKGMMLPDPEGNKQYFPKDYDVTCFDLPAKNDTDYTNAFQYIEDITVPSLRKEAQENNKDTKNTEELYIFVYQQSLAKQFQDYIAMRFGAERARIVDGWANVADNTAFSPIWPATIYHEGRHLATHGTWHDDAGNLLPNSQIVQAPSGSSGQNEGGGDDDGGGVGAGLLKFLNIPVARLPSCSSGISGSH
ncbi:MAG TPA: hypothetical protein VHA09_05945 [Nitrososphaera sp.]|nr:hypothetical protein [Nitrososphaera sp.]